MFAPIGPDSKSMQVLIESISLLLAAVCGLIAYRYMSRFFRLIFYQLCAWIGFYLIAWGITFYQDYSGHYTNNWPFFNLVILVETTFLLAAAYSYFNNQLYKQACVVTFACFVVVFVIQLWLDGFTSFLNYAGVMEGIAVILSYTPVLYFQFTEVAFSWKRSPVAWLTCGLLLYFTGIIPYLSVFNYINHSDPGSSEQLFKFIVDVLANIRYLMVAAAFWLIHKNAIQTAASHER